MSVPVDAEEKKLEVEQEAAPTLSPREADVAEENPNPAPAEENPNPAPEVEEAPVAPEASGDPDNKENKEKEEKTDEKEKKEKKEDESSDEEDDESHFLISLEGKDNLSLMISVGQSGRKVFWRKSPENAEKK